MLSERFGFFEIGEGCPGFFLLRRFTVRLWTWFDSCSLSASDFFEIGEGCPGFFLLRRFTVRLWTWFDRLLTERFGF